MIETGNYGEVTGDCVAEEGAVAKEMEVHIGHGGSIFGGVGDVDFGRERQGGLGGVQDLESANFEIEPVDGGFTGTPGNCCEPNELIISIF